MIPFIRAGFLAFFIFIGISLAQAQITYSGDTTGARPFVRPLEDLSGTSLTADAVSFQYRGFHVDTTGSYNFTSTQSFDGFLTLYQNGFDPTDSLTNAIIANDNNPTSGLSGFTYNLDSTKDYYLVTTGSTNTDMGTYTNQISGAGNVTLFPVTALTGDTTGGSVFNRPVENGSSAPTELSTFGTAVPYLSYQFQAGSSAAYNFDVTSAGFDSYLVLYQGTFDPSNPLNNALRANDDVNNDSRSFFTQNLTGGTSYTLVVTGFDNDAFGAFTAQITGPSYAIATPEPSSGVLIVGGLTLLFLWRKRRPAA